MATSKKILDMNEEEWSKHYSKQLEIKTDKSAGDDPVVCWLFTGRVNKAGYGVIDVIIPGLGKSVRTAHRMAALTHIVRSWKLPPDDEASHRCGQRLCVRPSHIVIEHHRMNKERQICHGLGRCIGHQPECLFNA